MPDYIEKYNIKKEGLRLENEDAEDAIKFYKDHLSDDLFINDYYIYRRLVLMYKNTREYDKKVNVIRCFFKSGIYCNRHNYLWFRNKLRKYSLKGFIDEDEIVELTDYFKTHGCKNKDKSNTPVPIADRIVRKRGEIIIDSEERYEKRHWAYEFEEEGRELKRQGRIHDFIKLYNHMIDDLGFRSYSYFQALCSAYRKIGDLDNELRIIDKYYNGESTRTRKSEEWFANREREVLNYLGVENGNELTFDKLFNDEEFIEEISENAKLHDEINILKKQIEALENRVSELERKKHKPNNVFLSSEMDDEIIEYSVVMPVKDIVSKKSHDINQQDVIVNTKLYDYEIPISQELEDELKNEMELFEYDESLGEVENILRKYSLKKRGLSLHRDDAVNYWKGLTKNSYFENDWYPYRQITIKYDQSGQYELNLNNIKEMFLSGVCLNNYQFIWFTNKIRKITNYIQVDESQVNEWVEYYKMNGAKNEDMIHKPVVNADRMTTKDGILKIFSKKHFDIKQKRYELRETCRMLESIGNYQREFDVIKEYYNEYPECRMNRRWYNDKLNKINIQLNSSYTIDDL